jgi:hypothetical protein
MEHARAVCTTTMAGPRQPPNRKRAFPPWGGIALPACVLWGTLIGVLAGKYFGNTAIGAAIGAGLGVGIGLVLFAAAVVVASRRF